MSVFTSILSLPWGKIILFGIDFYTSWKTANDEQKQKLLKWLEAMDEKIKQKDFGSPSDITDFYDDLHRYRMRHK